MLPAAATALAAALLAGTGGPAWVDPQASVELLLRSRSIFSLPKGAGLPAEVPAGFLELRPSALLLARTPQLSLSAEYHPRLFTGWLQGPVWAGVQHVADVSAELDLARGQLLRFTERAAYGYEDFGYIEYGERAWSLDVRPPPVQEYVRAQTELSAQLTLSRSLLASVALGHAVSGALDPADQALVPLQHGPYLSGYGAYSLTRRDTLITRLWSSYALYSGDRRSAVVRLSEHWRRELTRSTRAELGAGLGLLSRAGPGPDFLAALLPIGSAALNHHTRLERHDAELRLEARVAPHLNTITAAAEYRSELSGSATLALPGRAQLRARAGAAAELGAADQLERLLLGDLEYRHPLRNDLSVSAGALGVLQQVSGAPAGPTFQWSVYLSLVARTDAR